MTAENDDLIKVTMDAVGDTLRQYLENNSLEHYDIGILHADGSVAGVLISKKAYDFLLAKIEEADDARDEEIAEQWLNSEERNAE